jgi:hypothetical protein
VCSAPTKHSKSYSEYAELTIVEPTFGFFNWPNPSSRTMAMGSNQPLIEMSTSNFPGGGGGGRLVRLTNLAPSMSQMSSRCESLYLSQHNS